MKKITLFLILLLNTAALNAQSFTVFDIDTISFPVMKAKFYAFDGDYKQLVDLSPDDFEVYEDGVEREVLSVSCPEPVTPTAISSVLTMDISGSMDGDRLNKAKEAAKAWVNALPLGKSECAITSFDDNNQVVQDFTQDRTLLLNKINTLDARGGTDYDAGFINPVAGGLLIAKTGKYKKILVFLTDGVPGTEPDVEKIIREAKKYNVTVYSVTLDMPCPDCLKNISEQTGGIWYENVTSVNEARDIYNKILQIAQGNVPCEIEWGSGVRCSSGQTEITTKLLSYSQTSTANYFYQNNYVSGLELGPSFIYFNNKYPDNEYDTTITVSAINSDFNVSDVISSNQLFQVSPKKFSLKAGESGELNIKYIPNDSGYTFAEIDFVNDICPKKYYIHSGFFGYTPNQNTLKLTHPNGGEIFIIGSDTIITWEGISPEEKVILEYSVDNGLNWNLICDTASGLEYKWTHIPGPASNECLIKIKQLGYGGGKDTIPEIEWEKTYGGSNWDYANSIICTKDNGYIFVGSTYSNDGDISVNKGSSDVLIAKIDSEGQLLWEKTFGGSGSESAYDINYTNNGGLIVVGRNSSKDGDISVNKGGSDYWVLKLDDSGNLEWEKSFGGSDGETAYSVVTTDDNYFLIAGETSSDDGDVSDTSYYRYDISDGWLIKIDSAGNLLGRNSFNNEFFDHFYSIKPTFDNGFIIVGNSCNFNASSNDLWVVKIDSNLKLQWQKLYGGSEYQGARSVLTTFDGGYIVAGSTGSSDGDVSHNNGESDAWIIKLNSIGDIQWEKTYGGLYTDYAYSIIQDRYGEYIFTGASYNSEHEGNLWIVKIDAVGNFLWEMKLGGSSVEYVPSVQQANDGGYIIACVTESNDGDVSENKGGSDAWILKLTPEGKILQEDISDNVFSIVAPSPASMDIDMGEVLVGSARDSVVTDFIHNTGSWEFRVDSIYFRGADASAFSLVSGFPVYTVSAGGSHYGELRFRPNRIGTHQAEIVIITQADTLMQNIYGEGIEEQLAVICDLIDFGMLKLKESKDTVKALIANIGSEAIDIRSTEIIGPDMEQFSIIDGGGAFTLEPEEERELSIQFAPKYVGRTSTMIGFFHDGTGSPHEAQLYGEGVRWEHDCDSTGFEYPDFTTVDELDIIGSTEQIDDFMRLTYANPAQLGGIWHEKRVTVGKGFITEFRFRMSAGENGNADDGSIPGADGLAFVIQNNDNIETGSNGGGIGYSGIENALAVEFDLFKNDNNQIIDFNDPNGTHLAIQKSNDSKISALHNSDYTIELDQDIPELKSDGTVYYAKIEYNIEPNVMSVYLDETGVLDDPVIVAGGVKLHDIINLLQDQKAFVGITSATGNAYQIHDLLDWYFCSFPTEITAVESEVFPDEITFNIYPNPASESTTIEINNPEYQYISLVITDIFGREVKSLYSGYKTPGNISFKWNTGGITDGVYFCRLSLGDENFVKAVVVSK